MLHILNGAIHEVEPRLRTTEERKTRVLVFQFIRRNVSFLIYLKWMQAVTITVKKSTGGFWFDYATYWVIDCYRK